MLFYLIRSILIMHANGRYYPSFVLFTLGIQ